MDKIQKKFPQTAWIFDVDGVLTSLEEKRVTDIKIFDELVKRINREEPICFNTGRSIDFVINEILVPLEKRVLRKKLLLNLFAFCEKGAIHITYQDSGNRLVEIDQNIRVPEAVRTEMQHVVDKDPYKDLMFFDITKKTMVTLEMKKGVENRRFKLAQKTLEKKIEKILEKNQLQNQFRIDSTNIATDIESVYVGKDLGIKKMIQYLSTVHIFPTRYICFGDSLSDLKMYEALLQLGKSVDFVYVGKRDQVSTKFNNSLIFTSQLYTKGTLEFLSQSYASSSLHFDSKSLY